MKRVADPVHSKTQLWLLEVPLGLFLGLFLDLFLVRFLGLPPIARETMAYKVTRLAEQQIIDAYLYGARRFGVDQAERYADQLTACFELLSEHPRLARVRSEYRWPLRIHHHAKHYVVYRMIDDGEDIEILAVLHEASDLAGHLQVISDDDSHTAS